MNHPDRMDLLRAYVARLGEDMQAAGKFRAQGANMLEATVKAALNGATAVGAQLLADLRLIGGERVAMAAPIAEAAVAGLAADGARAAMGWAGRSLKDLFGGAARQKREQRKAGKALMEGAAKMGGAAKGAQGGRK